MRGAALRFGSLLLMSSLLAGCNGASYFPPSLSEAIEPCDYGSELDWYSSQLRAAREPRLGGEPPLHEIDGLGVLRFTWLRSLHVPVVVRVEATSDNRLRLIATELAGAGGRIARRVERRLSAEETARLSGLLAETGVLNLPPSADCRVFRDPSGQEMIEVRADGARWIIEANGSTGYRYVNRWSPEDGPVRDLGLHLVELTGWTYDRVY